MRRIGEKYKSLAQIDISQVLAKFEPLGQEVSYRFVPSIQGLETSGLFAITPLQVLAIQRKKKKEKKGNSKGTHYKVQGHKTTYSVN